MNLPSLIKASLYAVALSLVLLLPAAALGQAAEVGINYSWLHANAPAGGCGCFSANGGSGDVVLFVPHGFGFVGELSGYKSNNLMGTTQNVSLVNTLFGVRYTAAQHARLHPYGQALSGVSHESSNYAYVQSANAYAFALGGGLHLGLSRHVGLNLVQADWLHSTLPNAANNRQNDLRLGAGLYATFGSH